MGNQRQSKMPFVFRQICNDFRLAIFPKKSANGRRLRLVPIGCRVTSFDAKTHFRSFCMREAIGTFLSTQPAIIVYPGVRFQLPSVHRWHALPRLSQPLDILPEHVITNAELTPRFTALGKPTVIDRLAARSGITQRFYVPGDWVTSNLALPAAKEALKRASRKPEDVDLIILGTTSPDYITPATSVVLQRVPHSRHWSPSVPD
jgi:hypothetical protein